MKSFSNQGSKWVYTYMGKWQQYFESVGFRGNHCIRSRKLMPDEPFPNDGCGRDPACDVLPLSSMSTLCLLQSLVRWKATSAHKGGLTKAALDTNIHRKQLCVSWLACWPQLVVRSGLWSFWFLMVGSATGQARGQRSSQMTYCV